MRVFLLAAVTPAAGGRISGFEKNMTDDENGAALAQPLGVHLVGSVPLRDAEEVFRTGSATLGRRLRRIPDGKLGYAATGSAGKSSSWG